jgi:hypothetical protein
MNQKFIEFLYSDLDDKRFDLAFEAIDELYCHASTNDLVKAASKAQNIEMRPSEALIEFFDRFKDALRTIFCCMVATRS